MGDLTNLPTVGGDAGTWGQELNDALTELDTKKASAANVYTKAEGDARFLRTVNGVGPDANGDVVVDLAVGTTDQTARDAAAAAQAAADDIVAHEGVAGGIATLDPEGQLDPAQSLNLAEVPQNADGSWPTRPATTAPLTWVMTVSSSQPPAGDGNTSGGAGMVPVLDRLIDHTSTLGA